MLYSEIYYAAGFAALYKIPASWRPEGAFTDMGKTTQTDTFKRLSAVMKDVNGDNRQIVRTLQDQVEYLLEKIAILEEIATEENSGKVPVYSEAQKKRLAYRGRKLNEFLLATVERTFAPGTLRNWYNELVGAKYDKR